MLCQLPGWKYRVIGELDDDIGEGNRAKVAHGNFSINKHFPQTGGLVKNKMIKYNKSKQNTSMTTNIVYLNDLIFYLHWNF